ncbi:unnamed protein product [Symbiodinium microadriaticum]|nr:unnamed protein product [Symbiodinium microadriaticum]
MMQKMSEKIEQEGESEKDLYAFLAGLAGAIIDKFMCHCKSELEDFNKAVPKLESDISTAEAQISQLTQEIEAQRADEAATVDSMKRAGVEREKEHTVYVDEVTELKGDIGAIDQAIPALDEATQGAFVQTGHLAGLSKKQVDRLQHLVSKSKSARDTVRGELVTESDRQVLTSFLEGKVEAQGIGEVKGMLEVCHRLLYYRQRGEFAKEVVVDDKEEVKDVNIFEADDLILLLVASLLFFLFLPLCQYRFLDNAGFQSRELMNAKTNEKETIEETIADKIDRLGILKVSLVELKGELKDAQNALSKDFDVLQGKKLSETCDAKTHEWDVREKTRNEEWEQRMLFVYSFREIGSQELLAIQETVKILNSVRSKALDALKTYAKGMGSEAVPNRTNIDLVAHLLVGISRSAQPPPIPDLECEEQSDDDDKKDYCNKQAFENKRKTKALRHKIQTLKQAITTQAAKATAEEIKSLQAGVASLEPRSKLGMEEDAEDARLLDKSVAESTDMRKKEHEEYQKTVQEQAATKESMVVTLVAMNLEPGYFSPFRVHPGLRRRGFGLDTLEDVLLLAKNRLFQFYHPDMTTTLSTTGPYDLGLVQVEAHRVKEEPPEFGSAKPRAYRHAQTFRTYLTVQGNGVLNMLEGPAGEGGREGHWASAAAPVTQSLQLAFLPLFIHWRGMAFKPSDSRILTLRLTQPLVPLQSCNAPMGEAWEGLVTETEKTVAEAKYNEKESQQLYEAAAKREADIKAITSKQKAKATAEGEVVKKSEAKKAEKEELKDVQQYGVELDEAREQEKESLQSAKVLVLAAAICALLALQATRQTMMVMMVAMLFMLAGMVTGYC